jgi:hypothetical protein
MFCCGLMQKWFSERLIALLNLERPSDCELACVVTDVPFAPSSLYQGILISLWVIFFVSSFCGHDFVVSPLASICL